MDNEKLNTQLYDKMFTEQEKFRDWLLTQPAEEIINHTYEYTMREDILLSMEYNDLTDAQVRGLLTSPSPLEDLFHAYENVETNHMDDIRACIETRADELAQALRELPVYKYPASYARENNELELYRASHKANVACRDAIDNAIRDNYRDNCLGSDCAKQVIAEFGFDRTLYVLATTVRDKDWDGRIDYKNKDWAKTVTVYDDDDSFGGNRNREFVVDKSHPGLLDLFVNQARREYLLTQPLSKEDIQQEAARILKRLQAEQEPNSPKGCEASLSVQHFVAEVSKDFMLRAKSKDTTKLSSLLPFQSLSLSTLTDRKGVFAIISKDENRNQPLRTRKPSVRDKLKQSIAEPKIATSPKKSKETER